MSTGTAVQAVQGFERRLTGFATGVQASIPAANRQAAELVATHVAGFLGGRTIRLRGVGYAGANVGVRVVGGSVTGRTGAIVRMTGKAQLIERDTSAHALGSKQEDRGEQPRMRPGGGTEWRTGPFEHPGTQGKHPFAKGVDTATPLIPEVFHRGVAASGRKAFGTAVHF